MQRPVQESNTAAPGGGVEGKPFKVLQDCWEALVVLAHRLIPLNWWGGGGETGQLKVRHEGAEPFLEGPPEEETKHPSTTGKKRDTSGRDL